MHSQESTKKERLGLPSTESCSVNMFGGEMESILDGFIGRTQKSCIFGRSELKEDANMK